MRAPISAVQLVVCLCVCVCVGVVASCLPRCRAHEPSKALGNALCALQVELTEAVQQSQEACQHTFHCSADSETGLAE